MPSSANRTERARLKPIRVLICDVDGVLTRGDLLFGPDGEYKVFHVQDGQGISLAREAGLRIAWVTARRSEVVRRRAAELKIDVLMQGVSGKRQAVRRVLSRLGIKPAEAAYVGDDLVDLGAFDEVGYRFAVANAVPEVKAMADGVTRRSGGDGAVREVIEQILKAQGAWAGLVAGLRSR